MVTVHLQDNRVTEVIPEYALPVEKWYGEKYAKECIEAPDEVGPNWVYNPVTESFSAPDESGEVEEKVTLEGLKEENKLLKAQLQAQSDRSDFIEDCIAEMATQVYGGV